MLRLVRRAEGAGFERPQGMPDLLCRLLAARGVRGLEEAEAFLNPSLDQLHDPLLLGSMNDALSAIYDARSAGARVCVYGDYDVDGVCATAMLTSVLRALGLDARGYIPSRHEEGYGLNEAAIREIARWAQLLITVDCGVTASGEVALAQSLGMSVVVTDHHRPAELLPDCPVINPLLSGYPFPSLCGAGVALKLSMALDRDLALRYLDLAALATVADLVPLTSENRAIVALGIEQMKSNPRPGVLQLMHTAAVQQSALRAGNIAFQMAPRLNAGGRLGDADRALRLLTAASIDEAAPIAEELEAENTRRREVELQILAEVDAQMASFDFAGRRSIVLHGEAWNVGVVGLAASRLVERHHLPTVLIAGDGEVLHGSCRSIPGVDIHEALGACRHLLQRFGGHKQAAGITIERGKLDAFREALDGYIAAHAEPVCFIPSESYDMRADLSELDDELVSLISRLEPFGMGNPQPVLLSEATVERAQKVGKDGSHLSLTLSDRRAERRAIAFRMADQMPAVGERRRVLYVPKINVWNGNSSVQLELRALLSPAHDQHWAGSATRAEQLIQSFLTERLYNIAYPAASVARPGADDLDAIRALMSHPSGTLVAIADPRRLEAFLCAAEAAGAWDWFDLCLGEWPCSPARRNALCFCPQGEPPEGYRSLFCLSAPPDLWQRMPDEVRACGRAAWQDRLPDVDSLRALYVALRDLASRPSTFRSIQGLVDSLAADGMDGAEAAAGLVALQDMELIELMLEPPTMRLLPMRKRDPGHSVVYQFIQSLKAR